MRPLVVLLISALVEASAQPLVERARLVHGMNLRTSLSQKAVLKVAGPIQLTGKFGKIGLKGKAALELWAKWSAGSSQAYSVELALEDDGSDITKSVEIAKRLSLDPSVNVIVTPYTSGASIKVVEAVAGRKPVLVWGGASEAIFATGYKNVFGFMSTASEYMSTGLDVLKAEGAQKVVLIRNQKKFSDDVCDGARAHAESIGMTVQEEIDVKNDGSDVGEAMFQLRDLVTDVVVICGHLNDVEQMTKEMLDSKKYPHFKTNMVLSTQVSDATYRNRITDAGLSIDNCMMMPTQWVRTEQWTSKDDVVGWTSDDFVAAYSEKTGSAPSYHAAAAAAAGIALSNAIRDAGGFADMEAVMHHMYHMDIETFYGPISFAPSGALRGKPMMTVQNHPDKTAMVVAPEFAKEAEVIYPMSGCIDRSTKSSARGVAHGMLASISVVFLAAMAMA